MEAQGEDLKCEMGFVNEINISQIKIFLDNVIDKLFFDFKKKFKEHVTVFVEQLALKSPEHSEKGTQKEMQNQAENKLSKRYEPKIKSEKRQQKSEWKSERKSEPPNYTLNDSVLNVYVKQVAQHHKDSLIEQLQPNLNDAEINQLFENNKEEHEKIIFFNSTKDINLEKLLPTINRVSEQSCQNENIYTERRNENFQKFNNNGHFIPMEQADNANDNLKRDAKRVTNRSESPKTKNMKYAEKKCNFNERIVEPIKLKNEDDTENATKNEEKEAKKEAKTRHLRRLPPFSTRNDETYIMDYFPNKKRNVGSCYGAKKNSDIYKYCVHGGMKKSDTNQRRIDESKKAVDTCVDERKTKKREKEKEVEKEVEVEKEKKNKKNKTDQNYNPSSSANQNIMAKQKCVLNGCVSCDSDEINYEKLNLGDDYKRVKHINDDEEGAQSNETYNLLKSNEIWSRGEKIKNNDEHTSKGKKVETKALFSKPEMCLMNNEKKQRSTCQRKHWQNKEEKCANLFYEVVRGKQRKHLKGFDCAECKLFYEELLSEECEERETISNSKRKEKNDETKTEDKRTDFVQEEPVQKNLKHVHTKEKKKVNILSFFEDTIKNNVEKTDQNKNENIDSNCAEIEQDLNIGPERNMTQIDFSEEDDSVSVHLGKEFEHDEKPKNWKTEKEMETEGEELSKKDKAQKKKKMIQSYSRHRYHNQINDSPKDFWGFDFFK